VERQITYLVAIEGNSSFAEIVLNLSRRRGSMRDAKILLCLLGRSAAVCLMTRPRVMRDADASSEDGERASK
jgi:hypothetical protein